VNEPVQSGFTVYVPFMVTGTMLPFWLTQAAAVVPPFPSKICVPTLAKGPASAGGAVMNPVILYAKVPSRVVLEHPLSAACATGAMPRANAVATAIARVFAMLVRFMMISFCVFFYSCVLPPFENEPKTNQWGVRRR
jgi:hypothetical protein